MNSQTCKAVRSGRQQARICRAKGSACDWSGNRIPRWCATAGDSTPHCVLARRDTMWRTREKRVPRLRRSSMLPSHPHPGRVRVRTENSELSPAGTAESVPSRFSRPCGTSRIAGRVPRTDVLGYTQPHLSKLALFRLRFTVHDNCVGCHFSVEEWNVRPVDWSRPGGPSAKREPSPGRAGKSMDDDPERRRCGTLPLCYPA